MTQESKDQNKGQSIPSVREVTQKTKDQEAENHKQPEKDLDSTAVESDSTTEQAPVDQQEQHKQAKEPSGEETVPSEVAEAVNRTLAKEEENDTAPTEKTAPSEKGSSDEREFYDFGEDSSLEEDESEHPDEQQENKQEELDYENYSREALVQELEKYIQKENFLDHKREIALIKVAYLKATDIENTKVLEKKPETEDKKPDTEDKKPEDKKPDTDPLAERFQAAFNSYKQKKAEHQKEQEQIQEENLIKKKQILEELRELIGSEETLKKTYDDFKALQDQWKEVGIVPKAEVNELWKNYHFLVEKFFDKVKINKELRDLDLKKNLEQKIELCEQAEELILEPSVNKSFKQLQSLHEKYRQIGPVPGDKKEEVWSRFKAATEKIHDRRRKHYENLEQEQEKNLEAKTALCEKTEDILKRDLKTVKDWNNSSNEVKELMNIWRSIGFVPRQYNESIWNRFKTSVDTFYDNKKDFFNTLKEEQRENYNRKLNLCLEAEAIQDSTDWKKTTLDLIKLQKEWKKIGPVSRKHSDKLWKRFRAANDKFFNAKEEYFDSRKEKEKENLEKKIELIGKINSHTFGDDKNENLRILKEYQREWMKIGYVPLSEKDKIQKQYQDVINKHMDALSISPAEINSAEFKNHVDSLKEMPGGSRQLKKERGQLLGKISKLKEDVKLWENNTGFLANTKNADLLKKEFQEKIDKAKREISLLEAQMKMIDN